MTTTDGDPPPGVSRIQLGPTPVNLELSRMVTEERIRNFLFSGNSKGKINEVGERFSKDVETWENLHAKRLVEIENELESARQSWTLSSQTKAHQLMNERKEIQQNPPFIWLAELYGKAVERYLTSTQRRFGPGRPATGKYI